MKTLYVTKRDEQYLLHGDPNQSTDLHGILQFFQRYTGWSLLCIQTWERMPCGGMEKTSERFYRRGEHYPQEQNSVEHNWITRLMEWEDDADED